MKQKFSIFMFALFLMLSFGSVEQILACSCLRSAPCQNFDRADVVFVGKVVGSKHQITEKKYDDKEDKLKPVTYDVGEIYFEVTKAFSGTAIGSRLTIHSEISGATYGYAFERGKSYVVFASKSESKVKELWTGLCSGTKEVSEAKATLDYLQNLPKDGSGGMILGRIDESIKDYSEGRFKSKPMPDIEIKAQQIDGDHRVFYGTTNKDGYYEIKVPTGNYLVTLLDSNLFYDKLNNDKLIKIPDKSCEVKNFNVINDSRIEGRIIDARGNPAIGISIDLIPVGRNRTDKNFDRESAYIGEDGFFSFSGIPLGRYQISLNYTDKPEDDSPYPTSFFPNTPNRSEANIFEIEYGMKIKDLIFELPPKLKKLKITGQVFWENEKPAKKCGSSIKRR